MSYANRGMVSEDIIERTCKQYKDRNLAIITKVPTPIQVLQYKGNKITGIFKDKSTVDFNGVLKGGRFIAFDSKETREKSFPLKNIHQHQIDYLQDVSRMNGIAFILVSFSELDKYYRLNIKDLIGYIKEPWSSNKKSIPLEFFESYATEVRSGSGLYLDFLKKLEV